MLELPTVAFGYVSVLHFLLTHLLVYRRLKSGKKLQFRETALVTSMFLDIFSNELVPQGARGVKKKNSNKR